MDTLKDLEAEEKKRSEKEFSTSLNKCEDCIGSC